MATACAWSCIVLRGWPFSGRRGDQRQLELLVPRRLELHRAGALVHCIVITCRASGRFCVLSCRLLGASGARQMVCSCAGLTVVGEHRQVRAAHDSSSLSPHGLPHKPAQAGLGRCHLHVKFQTRRAFRRLTRLGLTRYAWRHADAAWNFALRNRLQYAPPDAAASQAGAATTC